MYINRKRFFLQLLSYFSYFKEIKFTEITISVTILQAVHGNISFNITIHLISHPSSIISDTNTCSILFEIQIDFVAFSNDKEYF